MSERFSQLHPAVNFFWFAMVIIFAMAVGHPVAQLIGLAGAVACSWQMLGLRGLKSLAKFCLPLAAFTMLLNPLFNRQGATPLFALPGGSLVTLESLLYGLSAGAMLCSVVLWFACFNRCICSDKFLFLFGRWLPGLSLVLSMVLGFVPRFVGQYRAVADAQKGLGRDMARGTLREKAGNAAGVLSITLTWALENAADTADSMKSRGYGGKRSHYALYTFTRRDALLLGLMGLGGICITLGAARGCFAFDYFPGLRWQAPGAFEIACMTLYGLLCAVPVIYNGWEAWRWRSLHSKI